VTDHVIGNTAVPRELKWKDKIGGFFAGYETAKTAGERLGLDVFFGFEHSDGGNDFLILGLGREFMLKNSDMGKVGLKEFLRRVRAAGGFIIHAHPFKEQPWIESIRLVPGFTDAVEVVNGAETLYNPESNGRALWYANEYNLIKAGGSDTHAVGYAALTGVAAPRRAKDINDLIAMIREGAEVI